MALPVYHYSLVLTASKALVPGQRHHVASDAL